MEGNSVDQLMLDFDPPDIKDHVRLLEIQSLYDPLIKISKQISSILF
ncbi:hypothetical protein KC685_00845 [Candidatus Dojkabacteria bacterium]|uniref:Uncharacterized protein n=1 Tax=Candidatus Dojkabacteria bacterium TaxID=2099670 RepID=A0A955HZW4_9BACT|nr:hypothetical protein [Candidatus Dojkabacteria bacterium]